MLQDIKRSIGEDFKAEYRNYLLLQNKIKEDIENDRHTFIERVQGAEMSLFIENVMSVASSSLFAKHNDTNVDEMVKHILERKKLIEAFEQENEKENQNFMANFIGIISDPGGDERYLVPVFSKDNASKLRNSIDAHDRVSINNIFSKIPRGMKIRDKFTSKIRNSQSIEPPSPTTELGFPRSLTNNTSSKLSLKGVFNKAKLSRTKTLHSDDQLSYDSSDLEFCENSRKYNNPEKLLSLSSAIYTSFLEKGYPNKQLNSPKPIEISEDSEAHGTIRWVAFKNTPLVLGDRRRNVSVNQELNPVAGKAKRRKLQMKSLIKQINMPNHRYIGPGVSNPGISHYNSTHMPSLNGVGVHLKNVTDHLIKPRILDTLSQRNKDTN